MREKRSPEGIELRHSKLCGINDGRRCTCDPSYRASVWDNDRRKRVRRTFPTKAAAKAWRRDAQRALETGTLRAPSTVTLRQKANEWLAGARNGSIRNRNGKPYKPSVVRGYERCLRLRVLPELGAIRFTELRRRDVQAFIDRMVASGIDAPTVVKTVDPLRAIYRHAMRRDEVAVNPTADLDVPKARRRRERVATVDEAAALISSAPEDDRALWATAFYGGLRRGELRALRCNDCDFDANRIRVARTWDDEEGELDDGKSENATREVWMNPALRDELIGHKLRTGRRGGDLLFGRSATDPFIPSTVRRRARAAWARDGLHPISLHEARHTWVSLCIAAGINPHTLMVAAGHGSYEMTMQQYGKVMPGALEEASNKFSVYLSGAGAR
jgi:integrase